MATVADPQAERAVERSEAKAGRSGQRPDAPSLDPGALFRARPPSRPAPPLRPSLGTLLDPGTRHGRVEARRADREFAGFRLLRPLGGTEGEDLWLARRVDALPSAPPVALMRLWPLDARSWSHRRALFEAKAEAALRLRHPNLCRALEAGEHQGVPWLSREYVEGVNLRLLRARAPRALPLTAVVELARQAAAGLSALHDATDARGVPMHLSHGAVSPPAILVGRDGRVRLEDVGLGLGEGRACFLAPEEREGGSIDRRTDVFALGLVLTELIAHAPLEWRGGVEAGLPEGLEAGLARRRGLPSRLAELVRAMSRLDPEARLPSMGLVEAELAALAAALGPRPNLAALLDPILRPSTSLPPPPPRPAAEPPPSPPAGLGSGSVAAAVDPAPGLGVVPWGALLGLALMGAALGWSLAAALAG